MNESVDVARIAQRIDTFAREFENVRFLTTNNSERIEQSKAFGRLTGEITDIIATIMELLRMPKHGDTRWQSTIFRLTRQKQYSGQYRDHLGIHIVNASLLELQLRLLIVRADAHRSWLEQSTEAPNPRRTVQKAIHQFKANLHRAAVRLNALNLHTVASAFRSWSDELSIPATTISGWLEAAIPVSRDLRFLANQYETRWRWKSLFDDQFPASVPERLNTIFLAILHTGLGLLAGYGLKSHRFVFSLVGIMLSFAGGFILIDFVAGCSRATLDMSHLVQYLSFSIQFLIGDQPQNPTQPMTSACQSGFDYIGLVGIAETGIGYLMLGILVSLLWAAIQRRSIDTSKIALPKK